MLWKHNCIAGEPTLRMVDCGLKPKTVKLVFAVYGFMVFNAIFNNISG
jgi:hypothetical protein